MPRGALADAEGLSEAIEDRRAALAAKAAGKRPRPGPKAVGGLSRAARRREKMFGVGRPRALDRNAKARIMQWARGLSRTAGAAANEIRALWGWIENKLEPKGKRYVKAA